MWVLFLASYNEIWDFWDIKSQTGPETQAVRRPVNPDYIIYPDTVFGSQQPVQVAR